MKIRVQIGKETIIFVLLLIMGCYCLFAGLDTLQKERNAIHLEQLVREECKAGCFVTGQICSYVGKSIGNSGKGSYWRKIICRY